jgi:hypothetical protein
MNVERFDEDRSTEPRGVSRPTDNDLSFVRTRFVVFPAREPLFFDIIEIGCTRPIFAGRNERRFLFER